MKLSRSIAVFAALVTLAVEATPALCQIPIISPKPGDTSARTRFRVELDKELAQYPDGWDLYRRTDLFSRYINRRVTIRLALTRPGAANAPMSSDTATSEDIFKNSAEQNETTIAISRTNPKLIVAAANDDSMWTNSMPAFVSTNGGIDWSMNRLPKVNDRGAVSSGDPIIVSDDSGIFYYAYMISSESTSGSGNFIADLMVAHSIDGKKWTLGKPVIGTTIPGRSVEDKETLAVDRDPASPHHGRIYIAWTHFIHSGWWREQRMIAHSDDRGVTWSKPMEIPTQYGYIALLRVGKGGTVFIGSSHIDSLGSSYSHGMLVSHDGGATFTEHPISNYIDYPRTSWYINALKGDFGPRAFPYVAFDVDPKDSNTLYAVYGNYDANLSYAAQYAIVSKNEGISWTAPKQIGTPNLLTTDHFQPWVAFDPSAETGGGGRAYVSLYSSEADTDNNLLTQTAVTSFDDLTALQPLGWDSFDPTIIKAYTGSEAAFIGDYTGCDAFNGTFAATWTQNRPGFADGDIYAYVTTGTPGSTVLRSEAVGMINERRFSVTEPYPNPVTGTTAAISVSSNESGAISVRMFDLRGREVLKDQSQISSDSENRMDLNVGRLPAGVYRVVIAQSGSATEKNLIILR